MTESERVLRNEEKYSELVDLFKSKRLHKNGEGGGEGVREGGREGGRGGASKSEGGSEG